MVIWFINKLYTHSDIFKMYSLHLWVYGIYIVYCQRDRQCDKSDCYESANDLIAHDAWLHIAGTSETKSAQQVKQEV